MTFPKEIKLSNNGIEYTVKVNHWQKHGKSRLYINELGLTYDLDNSQWMGKMAPQKEATAKQVESVLGL